MRNAIIMLITAFIFLSFFTVFLPVETCVASGNTIYVDADNTEGPWDGTQAHPYQDIQNGINAANESGGDTVYVYSGEYNKKITIGRPLTLTGEGSGITTISASGDHTIRITADSVSISGFTIKNTGVSSSFSSVFLSSVSSGTIQNNIIRDGGNGVYLVSSNSNTVKDNIIEYNNIGIYLSNSNSNTIQSNTIQHNNANGIFLSSSSNSNTIYLNHFSNNIASNARDQGSNSWSYDSQGNYWDDYDGVDEDPKDDIGDTPYGIPPENPPDSGSYNNYDNYPLGYFGGENQMPIANAGGPYSGQVNSEITFDGSGSSDPDGNIVGYRWDWTNDDTYDTIWFTISSATHSYSAAGSYTVKLQVKDDDGATNTDTAQVTITEEDQKPTAIIVNPDSPTSTVTYGDPVDFHGYGLPSEGMITEWSWRSSIDGILSSESTFNKSDLSVGTHIIYFKVKDGNGWSDEVSTNLVIESGSPPSNEPPIADAGGPYTGYVNVSISFDASGSYDPDGDEIVSYVWDFGDGTNGTGMPIEHTYNSTGNYTVKLNVTDNSGKTDLDTTYANVSIQPTDQNGIDRENGDTPGFEIIFIIIAAVFILLWKKNIDCKKLKKKKGKS